MYSSILEYKVVQILRKYINNNIYKHYYQSKYYTIDWLMNGAGYGSLQV